MNFIIQGGVFLIFLFECIVVVIGVSVVELCLLQVVCLMGVICMLEFEVLVLLIEVEKFDWVFVYCSKKFLDFGLICFDMDLMLIIIECIDELVDFVGKKVEVLVVIEVVMCGEIDYWESLCCCLVLLVGFDVCVLVCVYGECLLFLFGVCELLEVVQNVGLCMVILFGGFIYFIECLCIELGFDFVILNELEIFGGKLIGYVVGDIVDVVVKVYYLL